MNKTCSFALTTGGAALLSTALLTGAAACWNFPQALQDCQAAGRCGPDGGAPDGGASDGSVSDGGTSDGGTSDGGTFLCGNGVCLQNAYSAANGLTTVWGSSPNAVFMAGVAETVAFWDGGFFDEQQAGPYGNTWDILAIGGTSPSDVWAVGRAGLVLYWDGRRWSSRNESAAPGDLTSVFSTRLGEALTAGPDGVRFWERDGDAGILLPAGTSSFTGVWGTNTGQRWAVGNDPSDPPQGLIAQGNAQTWSAPTVQATAGLHSVHGTADNNVWAAGRNGTLVHFTGAGWQQINFPGVHRDFWSVWASPTGEAWITNYTSSVFRVEPDGGWTSFQPVGANGAVLVGIYGFDNGDLWLVGGDNGDPNGSPDAGFAFRYKRTP